MGGDGAQAPGGGKKPFFFEKRNQKTFTFKGQSKSGMHRPDFSYIRVMLGIAEIDEIGFEVAMACLRAGADVSVASEETGGFYGDEQVRVTFFLRLMGDEYLKALLELHDRLSARGDNRLAGIRYRPARKTRANG